MRPITANLFWTQLVGPLVGRLVGRLPGGRRVLDRRSGRALARMEAFQYAGHRPPVAPVPEG